MSATELRGRVSPDAAEVQDPSRRKLFRGLFACGGGLFLITSAYRATLAGGGKGNGNNNDKGKGPNPQYREKGNNGVGNGLDPQPPGNPPINDGPATGPGNPGNRGGAKK